MTDELGYTKDAIIDLNFAIYDHKFKNTYFCLEYFDL